MTTSTNTLLEPTQVVLSNNDVSTITYLLPGSVIENVVTKDLDEIDPPPDPFPDEPQKEAPVGDGLWIIMCCGIIYMGLKLLHTRRWRKNCK